MNRENYDKKVLAIFNIIGCYFVNHYYNALYYRSKKAHDRYGRSSLTDEYKKQIEIFHDECGKSRTHYTTTIRNLHNYYQTNTKFRSILLQDFISNILGHFLPDEHYNVMNDQEKSHFLHRIVNGIIRDFTIFVSEIGTLQQVIDDHANETNPEIWVNKIMDIQIIIREKLWQDFVRKGKRQTVDLDTFNRMQDDRDKLYYALQECMQETVKIKTDLANARRIVEHYSLQNGKLESILKQKGEFSDDKVVVTDRNADKNPLDKPADRSTDKNPLDKPAEKSTDKPSTDKSTDKPAEKSTDKSTDKPKSPGRSHRRPPRGKPVDPFSTPVDADTSEPSSSEDEKSSDSDNGASKRPRGRRTSAKPPARTPAKPQESTLIDFTGTPLWNVVE